MLLVLPKPLGYRHLRVESGNKYRWLWTLLKIAVIFGMLSITDYIHLDRTVRWILVFVVGSLAFQWFIQPGLERWLKEIIKEAMHEKQHEDEKFALSMDDGD